MPIIGDPHTYLPIRAATKSTILYSIDVNDESPNVLTYKLKALALMMMFKVDNVNFITMNALIFMN